MSFFSHGGDTGHLAFFTRLFALLWCSNLLSQLQSGLNSQSLLEFPSDGTGMAPVPPSLLALWCENEVEDVEIILIF